MKNSEFLEITEIADNNENAVESNESADINNYWRKFRLPGTPPKAGSIAEKRLLDACKEYAEYLFNLANISWGDSTALAKGSDEKRRELHNNIAIMIAGRQRSGMDNKLALAIADFAAHITFGDSIINTVDEINKHKNN